MSRVLGWGPAALWAAVLFLLSELPDLGLSPPAGTDKLVHGALYSILGLSLAWGRGRTGSNVGWVLLLLIGVGYGALDEWHQSFVPDRDANVGDWVADGAGVVLGLLLSRASVFRPVMMGGRRNEGTTTTVSD